LTDQNPYNFSRGTKPDPTEIIVRVYTFDCSQQSGIQAKQISTKHLAWATDDVTDAVTAALAAFAAEEAGE